MDLTIVQQRAFQVLIRGPDEQLFGFCVVSLSLKVRRHLHLASRKDLLCQPHIRAGAKHMIIFGGFPFCNPLSCT